VLITPALFALLGMLINTQTAKMQYHISPFNSTVVALGDDPAANLALWNRIQSEVHKNTTRNTML
jgi:hypothetical protein